MPLNLLYAFGHLVTSAAGVRLRLTALVLKVVSDFLSAEPLGLRGVSFLLTKAECFR